MATHSSIFAWRIPWIAKSCKGLQRVAKGCKELDMTEATEHTCTQTTYSQSNTLIFYLEDRSS